MLNKLVFLSALSVVALSGAAQAATFNPGTYTAVSKGNGGEVPVTVTFTKNAIESVKIGANKETPGIGSIAIEKLPKAIVDSQSLALNGVSGASITSHAILAAVAACVKQAGGNVDELSKAKAQKAVVKNETLNADIAVVGAGAAGQTATIRASQLGKKVILIEKMPFGENGIHYTIKAPVVILTTGGFGANKSMLAGSLKNSLYYGVKSSNGEGHQMAMKIGAKTQMMDLGKIYPNGMEVAPGIAKSTIWSNKAAFEDHSGIMVNKAGKRVISELDTNHNIKNEEVKQGGKLFILMDQPSYDAFLTKLSITGISKSDMDKWLAQDGKGYPIVVKADSIPAVAKKAGVDGAELLKTVARYNGFVKAGKDALDPQFRRETKKPPFGFCL